MFCLFQLILLLLSSGVSSMISSSNYYTISHFSDKKDDKAYLYIFITGAACNIIAGILAFFDKERKFEFFNNDDEANEIDRSGKLFKSEAQ